MVEQFSGAGIVSVSMKLAGHAVLLARHNNYHSALEENLQLLSKYPSS